MVTEQPKVDAALDLEGDWKAIRPRRRGGRAHKALMVGHIFGRLTVVAGAGSDRHGASLWRCKCVCGKEKVVPRGALKSGRVKSCGCLLSEYKRAPKVHLGHKSKARGGSRWRVGVDSIGAQQSLDRIQDDMRDFLDGVG